MREKNVADWPMVRPSWTAANDSRLLENENVGESLAVPQKQVMARAGAVQAELFADVDPRVV
jgi:hypothetical protein